MKMFSVLLRLLVPILILLGLDYFVYEGLRLLVANYSGGAQLLFTIVWWSVPVLLVFYLMLNLSGSLNFLPRGSRSKINAFFVLIYLSKFLMLCVFLFGDLARLVQGLIEGKSLVRTLWLSRVAAFVGLFPIVLLTYGMIRNPYRYKLHEVDLELPDLPADLVGLKLVQISDVHSGSFGDEKRIQKGIDLINAQEADFVFFTGDLVNSQAKEMEPYIDLFKGIKGKYGVYSIMGNHDYGDYHSWPTKEAYRENAVRFREIHQALGWNLLLNRHERIRIKNSELAIIGVENYSASKRFHKYGDLAKASAGLSEGILKVLLSHDPSHWDDQVNTDYKDIALTLSGHTHGFQFGIEIPGWFKWSPSRFVYKQWAGLYQSGKQYLYVNRGFGFIGYPGRVGILPEVTKIVLKTKTKA